MERETGTYHIPPTHTHTHAHSFHCLSGDWLSSLDRPTQFTSVESYCGHNACTVVMRHTGLCVKSLWQQLTANHPNGKLWYKKSHSEHRVLLSADRSINSLPLLSPAHRGHGAVVGFLKVGYKKLFLLVSHIFSFFIFFLHLYFHASYTSSDLTNFILFSTSFIISACCLSSTGPTGCARRGGATVCFGFLHRRELAATRLRVGAVWFRVAGEAFLCRRQITETRPSVLGGVITVSAPGCSVQQHEAAWGQDCSPRQMLWRNIDIKNFAAQSW